MLDTTGFGATQPAVSVLAPEGRCLAVGLARPRPGCPATRGPRPLLAMPNITGWGVPDGTAVLTALAASAAT